MNPDAHRGHKSFFERKAERIAAKGQPSDHQKAAVTPVAPKPTVLMPKYSGYAITPTSSWNQMLAQINVDMQKMTFALAQAGVYGQQKPDPTFSGKEFAAGVARGARSFKVDSLGRLTGIHYAQVWVPGENLSECRSEFGPHKDGDFAEKCRCGFYGYYDGSNDFHSGGLVSGVIEGYGDAVLGSRGFRVTKARIVALTIADDVSGPLARLVRRNYADIPFFDTFSRMVAEFPPDYELDAKTAPSPDSDPDFWSRSI